MSLTTQLSNLTTRIGTEFKGVRATIGSLVSLSTTEKGSLVGAINEVHAAIGSGGSITADSITDATDTGRALMRSTSPTAARGVIGAGTSNLAVGPAATDAKPGNYTPAWNDISSKPVVIASGATAAAARDSIGAGTSNLAVGPTATDAKPGDYTPAWGEVSGKPIVIASGVDAGAARSTISVSSTSEMNAAITTAVNNLIAGAPIAYDTFKEIADYIAENEDALGAIMLGLGNRLRVDDVQNLTEPQKLQGRSNLDVYSKSEIGNHETDLVAVFEAALV